MATVQAPLSSEAKAASPVDLSTIPISPEGGSGETKSAADDEQITVFHDADNFNVKHPLMHKWTLWFTKPPSGKARITFFRLELLTY